MVILDIQNLEYRAKNGQDENSSFRLAVRDFQVSPGERVAIVGPSGCGKSTFLNLIAGAVRPDAGTIRLMDMDLPRLSDGQLDQARGQHLGLLFQSLNLLPFASAIANVNLAGIFASQKRTQAKTRGSATALLSQLGLADPSLVNRPVRQLSIGQQQRVAAARALYGSPALVLADEPTSALDSKNRDQFLDVVFQALDNQRQAFLMVTHDRDLATRFDRVVDMTTLNTADSQ